MIKKATIFFLLFTTTIVQQSFCQVNNNDRQLADQYLNNGEYEKAVSLYDKLFDRDPYGVYYNYMRCLMAMRNFPDAEKLSKKMVKKNDGNLSFLVDLGNVYTAQGDAAKAKQQYDKAIKSLKPDQNQVITLANSFFAKQLWDEALNTYAEGKKMLKGYYSFNFETAEVYFQKGEFQNMLDEYFDAVEENVMYMQNVQNILQARIANDPDNSKNEFLRTSLLRRIQRNPDKPVFSEMLIWLFIQQKDFDAAFIQAKGLDKRQREDGGRIISLAQLATSNKNYDAAIKCYQYVIEKGADNSNYITARMELLNTQNKKITESGTYSNVDLLKLEKDYENTLKELGKNSNTVLLISGLAHLQVFYLDKTDSAIVTLEEAISFPGIRPQTQAQCKLELGDILLFTGNVWDSDLLYKQVDKSFKHDPLGQEAKYRAARLDFYRGDFLWALSQLDVLKSATSQLIANDALLLSLLISDNIGLDSTFDALLVYSRADLLSYQNKNDEAMLALDSLLKIFSDHSLVDDALFKESKIFDIKRNYAMEDSLLKTVVEKYADGVLADDALFARALLYETKLNDKPKAMELYQDLITKFPGSLYCVEARKKFRALRGDTIN